MYANGSATSSTDAVQQLVTFLVAAGWTSDMSAAEGSGWRAHLHKDGNYVHLRAAENEQPWLVGYGPAYAIDMYTGTAFDSGQAWNNQVSGAPIAAGGVNPIGVGMPLSAGPFSNYYFFTDAGGDNVVVVIEQTAGLFKVMGWGPSLNKAGAYTGGPYFFGSCSGFQTGFPATGSIPGFTTTSNCPGGNADALTAGCTFVRADVDSFTGLWICCSATTTPNWGYTGKLGDSSVFAPGLTTRGQFPVTAYVNQPYDFWRLQTSDFDGRANLLPILLWVLRDGTTTGFSLLGDIPNVFQANAVGNGFSDAEEYPIGANTYKLFPNFAVQKVV